MEPGRIPKDLLYGELATGTRPTGRPKLRFRDVCKRDLKSCDIDTDTWEATAEDRSAWRSTVGRAVAEGERRWTMQMRERRDRRKASHQRLQQATTYCCAACGRDCRSRIGLHSHMRRCRGRTQAVLLHRLPEMDG